MNRLSVLQNIAILLGYIISGLLLPATAFASTPHDGDNVVQYGAAGQTDDGFTIKVGTTSLGANGELRGVNTLYQNYRGDVGSAGLVGGRQYSTTYVPLVGMDYVLINVTVTSNPPNLFDPARLVVIYDDDNHFSYADCGTMTLPSGFNPSLGVSFVTRAGVSGSICRAIPTGSRLILAYAGDTHTTWFNLG